MFTRKQIEEIAAKLADLAIKDSQFNNINKPLNGSENLPVLQDGENRLMTLSDLVNLIIGDEDRQYIKCILNIECLTSNATIEIKGQGQEDFTRQDTYTAYYGEIVDVRISAEGYDTWQEVVTMTQDHIIIVSLNEKGSGSGPTQDSYYVRVINTQGAQITLNGSPVSSGSVNYFIAGDDIDIIVSKPGFITEPRYIKGIDRNYDIPIDLDEEEETPQDTPYIRFNQELVNLDTDGNIVGDNNVRILSNCTWAIAAQDSPSKESTEDDYNAVEVPDEITVPLGEERNIVEDEQDMGKIFTSKDPSIARVVNNKVEGVSEGTTEIETYDAATGTYLGKSTTTVKDSSDIVEPESIQVDPEYIKLTPDKTTATIKATVLPANADQTVYWTVGYSRYLSVSPTGVITKGREAGSTYVMAYTGDRKIKAKCIVDVELGGTFVTSVTPTSVEIPACVETDSDYPVIRYVKSDKGGTSTGVQISAINMPVNVAKDITDNQFTLCIPENLANDRYITVEVYGKETGDKGQKITVHQAASSKSSGFVGGNTAHYYANASSGADSGHAGYAEPYTGSGAMYFKCGFGRQMNVLADAEISDSWIHLDLTKVDFHDLYGYTAAQQMEYRKTGKIDGKVPDFSGKGYTVAYYVIVNCDVNTTGQARTGTITLPGYNPDTVIIDDPTEMDPEHWRAIQDDNPLIFTITQDA